MNATVKLLTDSGDNYIQHLQICIYQIQTIYKYE